VKRPLEPDPETPVVRAPVAGPNGSPEPAARVARAPSAAVAIPAPPDVWGPTAWPGGASAPGRPPRARPFPLPRSTDPAVPIPDAERLGLVDALRGIALLGILVVNLASYRTGVLQSLALGDAGGRQAWPIGLSALVEGHVYPLFAFLFGYGIAVQVIRSEWRGEKGIGRLARRMGALWLMGLVHFLFAFEGDILLTYATIGFVVLLLVRLSPQWLAGLAAASWLVSAALMAGFAALSAAFATSADLASARAEDAADRAVHVRGGFIDVIQLRLADLPASYIYGTLSAGVIAAMVLLGLAGGRLGFLQDPSRDRRRLKLLAGVGVPLGLAIAIPTARGLARVDGSTATSAAAAGLTFLGYSAGFVLAAGWLGTLGLAWGTRLGHRLLALVIPAGRMSLTCYLGQSLVCSLVFEGYGLGWGAHAGLASALWFGLGLWIMQIALATLWFRRFAIGPLEWVLRWATYARRPPLRRRPP
jgi:uncharacterized protein